QAVDLVRRLEGEGFGRQPLTLFFECRNLRELAAQLGRSPAAVPRPAAPASLAEPPPAPFAGAWPPSPAQRALWTNQRLHPESRAFSFLRLTFDGPLDTTLIAEAFGLLSARHPMLRARFSADERGQPELQVVAPTPFEVEDIPGPARPLGAVEEGFANRPFDLERGPLLRAGVAVDDRRWHLLLCAHHVVADGWSMEILARELVGVLGPLARGEGPVLASLPPRGGAFEPDAEHVRWWTGVAGRLPRTVLPLHLVDRRLALGEGLPTGRVLAHTVVFDEAITEALAGAAAARGVSLFQLLLTLYAGELAHETGQTALTVNIAHGGRSPLGEDALLAVGCFAETLPVGLDLAGDLDERLRAVRAAVGAALSHDRIGATVLGRLLPRDDDGPRAASPFGFSLARFHLEALTEAPPAALVDVGARTASATTRLTLMCWSFGGRLRGTFAWPEDLLDCEAVLGFAARWQGAVEAIGARGRVPGSAEDGASPLAARILAVCARQPEAEAIRWRGESVTYAALEARSATLAADLRRRGVGPGAAVAVPGTPGPEVLVRLLAVLRTGAVFVPLDPTHPTARLQAMVDRVGATVMLGDDGLGLAPAVEGRRLARDTAYVIFTSGSTGEPKGVPIPWTSLLDNLDWTIETFAYGPADRLLHASSICFDAALRPMLCPLMVGGTVVPATPEALRDPGELLLLLRREGVTAWSSVPTLWRRLLAELERREAEGRSEALPALRLVKLGGEALAAEPVRRWLAYFPDCPVVNLYGPTETTINAAHFVVRDAPEGLVVPIGWPTAGALLEVRDEEGGRCAVGESGELWIGGPGVAAGYLDDPQRTAERFVTTREGERFYKSGDRVFRRADDALVFVDRLDRQLKVSGHRIEPGEIEACLGRFPGVVQAAVDLGEDGSALVAWLEVSGPPPTDEALRVHLQAHLPNYMIPRRFRLVEAVPLLPSGKLDRAALPGVAAATLEPTVQGDAPASALEALLARAFAELCGVAAVGREADFFALGGDSMLALELFARLERQLGRAVPPGLITRHATVRALATAIEAALEAAPLRFEADDGAPFPLTAAQQGFALAEHLAPGTTGGFAAALEVVGPLDRASLGGALDDAIARHPALRTVFDLGARPPVQRVLHEGTMSVEWLDGRAGEEPPPFDGRRPDPGRWPLFALRVVALGPARHVLQIRGHHLVADGLSTWLLLRDLLEGEARRRTGDGVARPAPRTTVRDIVRANERLLDEPEVGRRLAWWRADLAALPPEDPPPAGAWTTVTRVLRERLVGALREAAAGRSVTLYELCVTALARAIGRVADEPEFILGTAVAGRDLPLPDLTDVLGCLATLLPLRVRCGDGSLDDELPVMARRVQAAREHALAPGRLVEALPPGARRVLGIRKILTFMDFSALPLPEHPEALRIDWGRSFTEVEPAGEGGELMVTARVLDGCLRLSAGGAGPRWDEGRLEALLGTLQTELEAWVAPTVRLDAALVGYLPPRAEVARLLGGAPEAVLGKLFPGGRPRLVETSVTPLGTTGLVCLPRFADELEPPGGPLEAAVGAAMDVAALHGARRVSLGGMLPSRLAFGHALAGRGAGPVLTTGHGATAVAVVLSVRQALDATWSDLEGLDLGVLGLGSIGRASLRLLLRVVAAPRSIVLCDVAGSAPRLGDLARTLVEEDGFGGPVRVVEARGSDLPQALYDCGLIVGASGTPGVLDIDRLASGTLLVDDSFPHCFDPGRALGRMGAAGDVLVTGGGLVDLGDVEHHLGPEIPGIVAEVLEGTLPPGCLPSCQVEPLLQLAVPGLTPTLGPLELDLALACWHAARTLGLRAAPLHLAAFRPDEAWFAAFRERGRRALA
ncbi:MAG: amino acid adenylation domain-containing protein, partial [Deltaproteobacteria bacterium]|nr:amino acid adenylation domain-containing protein [Deltaproteobacteria bacterium]